MVERTMKKTESHGVVDVRSQSKCDLDQGAPGQHERTGIDQVHALDSVS
jgi:hypothetical protein